MLLLYGNIDILIYACLPYVKIFNYNCIQVLSDFFVVFNWHSTKLVIVLSIA